MARGIGRDTFVSLDEQGGITGLSVEKQIRGKRKEKGIIMGNLTVYNGTGVWTITDITVPQSNQTVGHPPVSIKNRGKSQPISLHPGSYNAEVTLVDPNGKTVKVPKPFSIDEKDLTLPIYQVDSLGGAPLPPILIDEKGNVL
ncbi:MAG: hypothetical protein LBS86_04680 [Treponema sp.]|nr:hypothetical protein [Treponema sp.]